MKYTICADCKHYQIRRNRKGNTYDSNIWYNQLCGHPKREKKKSINFVTGEEEYSDINSLGDTCFDADKRPYCRDINDGNCKTLEPK